MTDTCLSLRVRNLTIEFPGIDGERLTIVEDLSFAVAPGQFLCLAGRSGSGKTSVLRRLAGLARPERGTVSWGDGDVAEMSEGALARLRRSSVSYLDQDASLVEELSCLENAVLPLVPEGRAAVRVGRKRAVSHLRDLGLAQRAKWRPVQMSGGERQRAVLARALTAQTPTILADEPTASLDHGWAHRVVELLRHHADNGGSVIVASHDPAVMRAANQVLHLDRLEPAS